MSKPPSAELSWEDLAEIEGVETLVTCTPDDYREEHTLLAAAQRDLLCRTIRELCVERDRSGRPCCAQGLGVDCPQHGRAA